MTDAGPAMQSWKMGSAVMMMTAGGIGHDRQNHLIQR
jgi:hypothetical protein